jgi:hypothetical protein
VFNKFNYQSKPRLYSLHTRDNIFGCVRLPADPVWKQQDRNQLIIIIIIIIITGVGLSPLGTAATSGLLYITPMID